MLLKTTSLKETIQSRCVKTHYFFRDHQFKLYLMAMTTFPTVKDSPSQLPYCGNQKTKNKGKV